MNIAKYKLSVLAIAAGLYRDEATEGNSGAAAAPELTAEQKAAADKVTAEAKEKLHTEIKANFNNLVDVNETSFHFRKVKDAETGIETKRPTVTIPVPAPSVEGLIAIIEAGGKGLELLIEAARDKVLEQAREYINDTTDVTSDNFPYSNLAWDFIANLPKAERRGGGIAKELWEDFAADYVEIMPGLTGKSKDKIEVAAKIFVSKFANAKTNKPVLKVLEGQLAIYLENTTKAEQFAPVIEWLSSKLETLIKTDETNLLLAL